MSLIVDHRQHKNRFKCIKSRLNKSSWSKRLKRWVLSLLLRPWAVSAASFCPSVTAFSIIITSVSYMCLVLSNVFNYNYYWIQLSHYLSMEIWAHFNKHAHTHTSTSSLTPLATTGHIQRGLAGVEVELEGWWIGGTEGRVYQRCSKGLWEAVERPMRVLQTDCCWASPPTYDCSPAVAVATAVLDGRRSYFLKECVCSCVV